MIKRYFQSQAGFNKRRFFAERTCAVCYPQKINLTRCFIPACPFKEGTSPPTLNIPPPVSTPLPPLPPIYPDTIWGSYSSSSSNETKCM